MKKTLFLLLTFAGLGVAQAAQMLPENSGDTVTANANGEHIHYNNAGGELTYAGTLNLGNKTGIWIGPGTTSAAVVGSAAALVHLTGTVTSTGSVSFNEYSNNANGNVIYSIENADSSLSGSITLNHGGNANSTVQLNIGAANTANVTAKATVAFEANKNNQVLHLVGDAAIAGLSTNCANSNVTSNNAGNTLTLNSSNNFSYAGTIGTGNYLKETRNEAGEYTGMNRNTASTSLNLVKQGTGTQTLTGNNKIGTLTVTGGKVALGDRGTTSVTTAVSGAVEIGANAVLEVNNTAYAALSGAQLSGNGTVRYASGQSTATSAINLTLLNSYTDLTLELKEVKGSLSSDNVINNNVKFTNGSWAGAEWTGAAVSTYTFNGSISGNGNFGITSGVADNITFVFNGDLSGWTGTVRSVTNRTMNIEIGGSTPSNKNVGAVLTNNGGKLNLTLSREATFTNDVTINNLTLKQGGVVNTTQGKTFTITGDITMEGSTVLTLTGKDTHLNNVTLASDAVLTLGSDTAHDFTLTADKLTTAGAATINANVDLTNTTSLALNGVITLGCDLELGNGGVELSGSMLDNLLAGNTQSITLFDGVDNATFGKEALSGKLAAADVFTAASSLDGYYVEYSNNSVMLTKEGAVPEPATGTLSLLALAGLCARRRRK